MIGRQELYTKWLRECPGADRFSIELTGRYLYEWKVYSWRSENVDYVILSGPLISGTDDQTRSELCRQLRNIMAKLDGLGTSWSDGNKES